MVIPRPAGLRFCWRRRASTWRSAVPQSPRDGPNVAASDASTSPAPRSHRRHRQVEFRTTVSEWHDTSSGSRDQGEGQTRVLRQLGEFCAEAMFEIDG